MSKNISPSQSSWSNEKLYTHFNVFEHSKTSFSLFLSIFLQAGTTLETPTMIIVTLMDISMLIYSYP